jgi:hypothetical protein
MNILTCRGRAWLIRGVFGLDDWIYLTPYSHNSEVQAIQRYCYSIHFTVHRYTRTRILSLHKSYPGNVFITVPLSLQITHEVLFSQPNSFLAILPLPIPKTRLNSIPLFQSSYPGSTLLSWNLLYNLFARTTQKTQPLCCWEGAVA